MSETTESERRLQEELEPEVLGHAAPAVGLSPEQVLTGNYWFGEDYESNSYYWIC